MTKTKQTSRLGTYLGLASATACASVGVADGAITVTFYGVTTSEDTNTNPTGTTPGKPLPYYGLLDLATDAGTRFIREITQIGNRNSCMIQRLVG